MKMIYGGVPVNSMKIKHYELNTNDCDMIASDLQAGKTAVARGKKITGTGKSFEFASYGSFNVNTSDYIPTNINVIEMSSMEYPIQHTIELNNMSKMDFSTKTQVGNVFINNISYPIFVEYSNNFLSITCEKSFVLQVFFGKDNYV